MENGVCYRNLLFPKNSIKGVCISIFAKESLVGYVGANYRTFGVSLWRSNLLNGKLCESVYIHFVGIS
jgi:hypothetical protein